MTAAHLSDPLDGERHDESFQPLVGQIFARAFGRHDFGDHAVGAERSRVQRPLAGRVGILIELKSTGNHKYASRASRERHPGLIYRGPRVHNGVLGNTNVVTALTNTTLLLGSTP
jgi:hypothetical protein